MSLRKVLLVCIAAVSMLCPVSNARSTEIWLAGVDPVWRAAHGWPAGNYLDLFSPGAQWADVAKRITVFDVTKRFVLEASDEQLLQVIRGLQRLGIKLSVQATPLVARPSCGRAVEGYGPPGDMLAVAQRLQRLGAQVSYLRMDEPLFYGHFFGHDRGRVGCRAPISDLATEAASKLATFRRIFPKVKVGDTEPFGDKYPPGESLPDLFGEWASAFARAYGEPLAFLHADIEWWQPRALDQFLRTAQAARKLGIPVGIIYNGLPSAGSDALWTQQAQDHFEAIESKLNFHPDQIAFSTWTDHPRKMLPESESGTMTNLILRYLKWSRAN